MDTVNCEEIIYSEQYGDYLLETFDSPEVIAEIYDLGCVQTIGRQNLVLHQRIIGNPEETLNIYGYTAMPKCYGLMDTIALEESGILRLRRQPYLNLYGSGVIVGIVDTGIDYRHPAFINADGSSRIYSIWDQTDRRGDPPKGFYYGTEYTRFQIEEALRSEHPEQVVPVTDKNGHGTFLAGVIAGNEMPEEDFSGIAPLADLVVVKLKEAKKNLRSYYGIGEQETVYQENDIMLGIRYIQSIASFRRKPVVILTGLGTNAGNHTGQLQLSRYMSRSIMAPGVAMISSAGNEGNQEHHYQKRLLEAGGSDIVEINIAEGETGVTLELWTAAPQLFTVGIQTPLGNTTGILPIWYGRGTTPITFPLENSRIFVEYTAVETNTGDEVIVIRLLRPTAGIWRIEVVNNTEYLASYNMWMPISAFLKPESRFLLPDPDITICEPGNAGSVLTATAYNPVDGGIYLEASRGFTNKGEIKPELAAPGAAIFGPVPGGGFTTRSGTSVGGAFCAGATVLILEWAVVQGNDPGIQMEEINNILIRGAQRERNTEYPNRIWGYGKLNAYAAFEQLRP